MSRVEIYKPDGLKLVGILEKNDTTSDNIKPLVILCHGYIATKNYAFFPELAKSLPIDTFRFDFSGYGESEGSPPFGGLEIEQNDIDAVVGHFTKKGYTIHGLIGHSRGGSSVLHYVATKQLPDLKYVINLSGRFDFKAIFESYRKGLDNKDENTFQVKTSRKTYEFKLARKTLENFDEKQQDLSYVNRIPKTVKVLTCHGLQDEVLDVSHAAAFANYIPNHTLRLVEGANHRYDGLFPEVISYVRNFILDIEPTPSQIQSNQLFGYTRVIAVEGIKNFRDAGGYASKYGVVRPRYLFRSGDPSQASDVGKQVLSKLGVKRIIDMRSNTEIQRHGHTNDLNMVRKHAPLLTEGEHSPAVFGLKWKLYTDKPEALSEAYVTLLEHGKSGIAESIRYILEDVEMNEPVIIHCAAGKDRTGLLIAIILWTLGVDMDTICGDYELTNLNLKYLNSELVLLAEKLSKKTGRNIDVNGVRSMLIAKPESLKLVLLRIQEVYGGPEGFLLSSGITVQEIDQLRKRLILPIRAKL